jgi:hypothetical protein
MLLSPLHSLVRQTLPLGLLGLALLVPVVPAPAQASEVVKLARMVITGKRLSADRPEQLSAQRPTPPTPTELDAPASRTVQAAVPAPTPAPAQMPVQIHAAGSQEPLAGGAAAAAQPRGTFSFF